MAGTSPRDTVVVIEHGVFIVIVGFGDKIPTTLPDCTNVT